MMNKKKESAPGKLSFDDWSSLARRDPDLFEKTRQKAIDELIQQAPADQRKRLYCLQWRIDQERKRAKTPLGACIRISRMMWESVTRCGGLLDSLNQIAGPAQSGEQKSGFPAPADVVPIGISRKL